MHCDAKRPGPAALFLALALLVLGATTVSADQLLQSIQRDLAVLGYDPGPADGADDIQTQLAIAKFEDANGMPVTGKASLAVAAAASNQAKALTSGAAPPPTETAIEGTRTAAMRDECLRRQQQQAQQKGSSWRNLATLGTRVAGRLGGVDTAELSEHVTTAEDVAALADELGLSEAQVEECM